MRWSISVRADGDRTMEREEIVELADAVSPWEGIASGIGSSSYAAQLVIEADTSDELSIVAGNPEIAEVSLDAGTRKRLILEQAEHLRQVHLPRAVDVDVGHDG